jgi:GAF domain-containing protein
VQLRTRDLARTVNELQALSEVSHAVNSTLDLETVLDTIVEKAVQLSATDAGAIYVFSKLRQKFRLRATYGLSRELIEAISQQPLGLTEHYLGTATHASCNLWPWKEERWQPGVVAQEFKPTQGAQRG